MIDVKIVKDSISPAGVRITTFSALYPRIIHSEFMTHREFSRNASSSRAIPVEKKIKMVKETPFIPLAFTKNKKGMQGDVPLEGDQHEKAVSVWLKARDNAVAMAEEMVALDIHKQYANRILEPFDHINVVFTATRWDNFFALRISEMAQPEIFELAEKMYDIYTKQEPIELKEGGLHLPYVDEPVTIKFNAEYLYELPLASMNMFQVLGLLLKKDKSNQYISKVKDLDLQMTERDFNLIKQSVARASRVSYMNQDGVPSVLEKDFEQYDRLVGSFPIHASPAEHQAIATNHSTLNSGNLNGFVQYRKTLKLENIKDYEKFKELQNTR